MLRIWWCADGHVLELEDKGDLATEIAIRHIREQYKDGCYYIEGNTKCGLPVKESDST